MPADLEPRVVEPEWIDITTLGAAFEEQIDVRSNPDTYRHRPRSFTGDPEHEWMPGRAPQNG